MYKIKIKPISINEAYRGRRFKTEKLKIYKKELSYLLPIDLSVPNNVELTLDIIFGLSSKGSDLDNYIKAFLDALQVKYYFNDNKIYTIIANKIIVKKGQEYIEFSLKEK